MGVHLSDNLTWNEHVFHIVKKGNKRLYAIRALKKCGLTDGQLILVYCSIIRSVLEYASPVWAGLTQYLSDQIEVIRLVISSYCNSFVFEPFNSQDLINNSPYCLPSNIYDISWENLGL